MFEILKTVQSAPSTKYTALMDAYGWAVSAATHSGPEKVEAIDESKLKTFMKCDNSQIFSVYADTRKGGMYYVVYVPRALSVWRAEPRDEVQLLTDQLNNLKPLINAMENANSKRFLAQMQRLRDSVQKNPAFRDIHHAAACNFPRMIKRLCANDTSIANQVSVNGFYPLHIAIENECKDAAIALLKMGADLTKRDCRSRNALHYAAEKSPEILRLLIAVPHPSNAIDVADENGFSPLCLAIHSAKAECVEILLDADCSTGPFPGGPLAAMVTVAAESPELPRIIDVLLIQAPNFLTERISGSSTILHNKLNLQLLYHILGDLGDVVNVDVRDGLGETPLYCAVSRNDLTQAIVLLAYGADVNIADYEGDTPLHVACKLGNVKMVKMLLCFGASVNTKNGHGATAADIAQHRADILECLKVFMSSPSVPKPNLYSVMQERALEERRKMTLKQREQLVNVLSMDGGGVRAMIVLQVLLHIEKLLGHPIMQHFNWIAGTSSGSIIAVALAEGYTVRQCQGLYLKMKDELFVGQKPYSEKVIERFLKEHFGETTTMAQLGPKKIAITASLLRTIPPVLRLFRSYTLPLSTTENEELGFDDPNENLVWKCMRCSSAAPTYFEPKDNFVDGGLMSNNPTLDLMADIHTYNAACIKAEKEPVHIGCILSVGTGQNPIEAIQNLNWNIFPRGISDSMSMFQDFRSMKNLLLEQITASNGATVKRAQSWAHDQSIPFYRFSPQLSTAVEIDDPDNELMVECLWDTEKHLRTDGKHDVETLVNYLKSL